jgi:hypothetical protein
VTVRELIEFLQAHDPEATVKIAYESIDDDIDEVVVFHDKRSVDHGVVLIMGVR